MPAKYQSFDNFIQLYFKTVATFYFVDISTNLAYIRAAVFALLLDDFFGPANFKEIATF